MNNNTPSQNYDELFSDILEEMAIKNSCSPQDVMKKVLSYYMNTALDSFIQTEEKQIESLDQRIEDIRETGSKTALQSSNNSRTKNTNDSIQLFYPYTTTENYKGKGYKICISWSVYGRLKSVFPYSKLISNSLHITDPNEQQCAVDEYFTFREKEELKKYLENYSDFSNSQFIENPVSIPITSILAPLSNIPRANYRYFFPIYQNEDYNLDFQVSGFYLGKYNYPLLKNYYPGTKIFKLYNDPIPEELKLK